MKKYHRPVQRISLSWLKVGELCMMRSAYRPRDPNEWVLEHGIGFWKDFPPPDIGDKTSFCIRTDDADKNLYEQTCLIVDKRIYQYGNAIMGAETLIQIVTEDKIVWVRACDLKKCSYKK